MKKEYSVAHQLGFFIGEYIIDKYLPTLSSSDMRTRTIIQVSEEENNEVERLHKNWIKVVYEKIEGMPLSHKSRLDNSKPQFEELRKYEKSLEKKYLPKILVCDIPLTKITDEAVLDDIKEGISITIWDCDMSHYSVGKKEDIEIEFLKYCTNVKLKLHEE